MNKQNFRFLNRRVVLTKSFVDVARRIVHSELVHLTPTTQQQHQQMNRLIKSVEFGTHCALLVSTRIENIDSAVAFIELMETFTTRSLISNQTSMKILCLHFVETSRVAVVCHKERVRHAFSKFIATVVIQYFDSNALAEEEQPPNLLDHLTSSSCFDFILGGFGFTFEIALEHDGCKHLRADPK